MAAAATTAALAVVIVQPSAGTTAASGPQRCGGTTLDGTIVFEAGKLSCGPGQALVVRSELQKAGANRRGTPILSFVALTDFQLADEESPLRGEFTDKCGDVATKAAFRWNDTMLPALLNSEVRAADQIAYGPVTGRPFDFAVQLGDASDNQQYNEVRQFIDLLDGGKLVNPDSGADGYEGNQGRDPYASPVKGTRLLDLANEPFWAAGFRKPDGSSLPWYTVMGNHDMKVRGTVPNDNDAWRTFARAWVTGNLMVNDLAPDQQQRVCADPTVLLDPVFWTELAMQPGSLKLITPDPNRRLLDRNEWVAEHTKTTGLPAGHGPAATARCKGADGADLQRVCYTWDMAPQLPGEPPVHFIALDTNADEGLDGGNIDQAQWNWLNEDLKKHSDSYFTDDTGDAKEETGNPTSLVVLFSHHTESTATNDTPRTDGQTKYYGADLQKLLLRFPNVVLHANGHTHFNKVWSHPRPGGKTGYWEVNTSAVADFPHQGRTIELVDNHDGTLSIFGVNFDASAPVDPSAMKWSADDTPETSAAYGSAKTNINEEYLASIARWVGANDPQSGAALVKDLSSNADKNVELLLKHPTGGVKLRFDQLPKLPRLPRFPRRPGFPFGGFPFPQPPVPTYQPKPFPFSAQPPPASQFGRYATTSRGIGKPFTGSMLKVAEYTSEYVMTVLAIAGIFWLIRARIRRNMVGL